MRHQDDLVIAGSFLLTDALVHAAGRHPGTRFILIDPLVPPAAAKNLLVVTVRRDQGAFVSGALGALTTRSGVIAGIYGPDGLIDRQQRLAFERGAGTVRPGVRVLGAFQPAGTTPYNEPAWGAAQARDFAAQHADVIFAAGGATGLGALTAATAGGQACIGIDVPKPGSPGAPGCLLARITTSIEPGLGRAVLATATRSWTPGTMALGFADGGLGLDLAEPAAEPVVARRIHELVEQLAEGRLATGV